MVRPRGVLAIEKCLGFKSLRGISRSPRSKHPPGASIAELEDGIDYFKMIYGGLDMVEVRKSRMLHDEIIQLFESIGPAMWPSQTPTPSWLVDATLNDLDGHYPRNLRFDNLQDQAM